MAVERHVTDDGKRTMMRALYLLVAAGLIACPVFAAEGTDIPTASLFFTPEQMEQIETLQHKPEHTDEIHLSDIHLGAILYYGPDNWVVWLQGERWTPETRHDGLNIVSVRPDEVHLQWTVNPAGISHGVALRPYQTYKAATGTVVEGM